jgi:hypothetical protein
MNKTGRRIWFGMAMALSVLALLLGTIGIVGVWILESALANTVVGVIEAVDGLTSSAREVIGKVDQGLEGMEGISTGISTASAQLAEQVTDKGLILVLLPEEQEQKLTEMATSLQETVDNLRSLLAAGVTMYQSINRIPFVDLPSPSEEQVENIQDTVAEIQSLSENVASQVTDFRAGITDQIGKVEAGADTVTSKLNEVESRLAELDGLLAGILEALPTLQNRLLTALMLGAILITLFLAWVIYSEVEIFRLYVLRWRATRAQNNIETTVKQPGTAIDSPPLETENSDHAQ